MPGMASAGLCDSQFLEPLNLQCSGGKKTCLEEL